MRMSRWILAALLACPFVAFAQKKQIQELQRDMALMQDEVRTMNEKLNHLTVLAEQLMDKVSETNTTVTVLDSSIKDSLKDQQQRITVPVVSMGSKVDQMAQEFRFVRESIADLNSRVGKLSAQMDDLKTATEVMAAPPPPPPGKAPGGAGAAAPGPRVGSAEDLYADAQRDQSGGKLDLALMEYQDFLKMHPNSDLAPAVQFGIGEILFAKSDFEAAANAFDLVLEKYPENAKTVDAMFMKGQSFLKLGRKRSAAREFRALVKKHPDIGLAQRARDELTKLGY